MSRYIRRTQAFMPLETHSMSHIEGQAVSVGQTYHLENDAQFKRDLEASLAEIVKKRLQEAEDEALSLVKIAEETAHKNAQAISESILNKANAQANEMVAVAQSQVDSIKEAAYEEGFRKGFEEGYADATQQVESETVELLAGVHAFTEKAYQAEKQVLEGFEKNAVAIVRHVSGKILSQELKADPALVLTMVCQAVESLYLSGKIKLVLNPQLLQEIRSFSGITAEALENLKRFELITDPLLERNQLFIIGEEASFELTPETQIEAFLTPLLQQIELPRAETVMAEAASPASVEPILPPWPEDKGLAVDDPLPQPEDAMGLNLASAEPVQTDLPDASSPQREEVFEQVEAPLQEHLPEAQVTPYEFLSLENLDEVLEEIDVSDQSAESSLLQELLDEDNER